MTGDISKPLGQTLEARQTRTFASLTLDIAYYQALLDEDDMPDDQKRELIETLWSIVVAFVDLGFGTHPVQQAQAAAGRGLNAEDQLHHAVRDFVAAHGGEDNNQKESTDI